MSGDVSVIKGCKFMAIWNRHSTKSLRRRQGESCKAKLHVCGGNRSHSPLRLTTVLVFCTLGVIEFLQGFFGAWWNHRVRSLIWLHHWKQDEWEREPAESKKGCPSLMGWHMPITPASGRLRQKDCKFKAILGYIISSSLASAVWQHYFKEKKEGLGGRKEDMDVGKDRERGRGIQKEMLSR